MGPAPCPPGALTRGGSRRERSAAAGWPHPVIYTIVISFKLMVGRKLACRIAQGCGGAARRSTFASLRVTVCRVDVWDDWAVGLGCAAACILSGWAAARSGPWSWGLRRLPLGARAHVAWGWRPWNQSIQPRKNCKSRVNRLVAGAAAGGRSTLDPRLSGGSSDTARGAPLRPAARRRMAPLLGFLRSAACCQA
jgi:hypothetical protein